MKHDLSIHNQWQLESEFLENNVFKEVLSILSLFMNAHTYLHVRALRWVTRSFIGSHEL